MASPRDEAVATLRRAGFGDLASQLVDELPETATFEEIYRWCEERGISRQVLVERLGGSP
jgi:hypothetical protein